MMVDRAVSEDLVKQLIEQGIKKGYLTNIHHNISGETYLTTAYIHETIETQLQHSGKVSLQELATLLNVSQDIVQEAWSILAPQKHWTRVDDLMLSEHFMDSLVKKLKEQISRDECVSLISLSQQFSLPYGFIQKCVQPLLAEKFVMYSQLPDMIMTKNFEQQTKQRIVSAIRDASEPLAMAKLQQKILEQDTLFYVMLEHIIKEDQLDGVLRGRRERAIFVPNVYKERQMALVRSLLTAGNYIEFTTVEQHYEYANPKELLRRQVPDSVLLDTCAATQTLLNETKARIETEVAGVGWLDITQHVPFAFSQSDIAALLDIIIQRSTKKKSLGSTRRKQASVEIPERLIVLSSRYLTTPSHIQTIIHSAQDFVDKRAQQEISQQKKQHSSRGKNLQEKIPMFQEDELFAYLVQSGTESGFARAIAPVVLKPLNDALLKATRSVYVPSSVDGAEPDQWILQQRERHYGWLRDLRRTIYFTVAAIKKFKDGAAQKSLQKYVARQLALEFLFYLVIAMELQKAKDKQAVLQSLQLTVEIVEDPRRLPESQKKDLIAALVIGDEQLVDLYQSTQNGKKPDLLLRYLTEACNFEAFASDSLSSEEARIQTTKEAQAALMRQLKGTDVTESNAPLILHLTSILYFQRLYQLPLYVSGKYVPHIIRQITGSTEMEATDANLLHDIHAAIITTPKQQIPVTLIQHVYDLGLKQCEA